MNVTFALNPLQQGRSMAQLCRNGPDLLGGRHMQGRSSLVFLQGCEIWLLFRLIAASSSCMTWMKPQQAPTQSSAMQPCQHCSRSAENHCKRGGLGQGAVCAGWETLRAPSSQPYSCAQTTECDSVCSLTWLQLNRCQRGNKAQRCHPDRGFGYLKLTVK